MRKISSYPLQVVEWYKKVCTVWVFTRVSYLLREIEKLSRYGNNTFADPH